jgi:pseudouridylate synthase
MMLNSNLLINTEIKALLAARQAVVALESAVIATGLPSPYNLQAAQASEAAIKATGAHPATVAIIDGQAHIGCQATQIEQLSAQQAVIKANIANLAALMANGSWGATTVSTTLHLAAQAGIKVFATGGIGGVHREAEKTFDISADLMALARYPLVVVSAGAKAILDLPRTVEVLETLGVPIIGYQTDEFPAFYSRRSGIKLDIVAETPAAVARIAQTHWQLGFTSAVLVAAPIPPAAEIPAPEIENYCQAALQAARQQGIVGKAVTPYLLARMEAFSQGRSIPANLALLENNARCAGEIAVALAAWESSTL